MAPNIGNHTEHGYALDPVLNQMYHVTDEMVAGTAPRRHPWVGEPAKQGVSQAEFDSMKAQLEALLKKFMSSTPGA